MAKLLVSVSAASSLDSRLLALFSKVHNAVQKDKDLSNSLGSQLSKILLAIKAAAKKQYPDLYRNDEDDYEDDADVGSHDVYGDCSFYLDDNLVQVNISLDGNGAGLLKISLSVQSVGTKFFRCNNKTPRAEIVSDALAFIYKAARKQSSGKPVAPGDAVPVGRGVRSNKEPAPKPATASLNVRRLSVAGKRGTSGDVFVISKGASQPGGRVETLSLSKREVTQLIKKLTELSALKPIKY